MGDLIPKPQIPTDPNFAAEQQRAQEDYTAALQRELQGDTAAIMARYGSRYAMASAFSPSSPGVK